MTYDNRMRTFEILDPNTKQSKGRARVNPRLVSFGLAITFITTAAVGTIHTVSSNDTKKPDVIDTKTNEDLELINKIIKSHKDMLVDKEKINYEVEWEDSLYSLASKFNTTIDRIKELNNRDGNTIYYKENLIIEKVTPKNELDQSIALLETYINDYVFNSQYARIARGEVETSMEQRSLFYYNLYGSTNAPDVDPQSIFGMNMDAYAKYHESAQNEEDKTNYINKLNGICVEIQDKINIGINYIMPFAEYETLVKNNNTKTMK